jgi:hypothetical protein
MTLAAVLMVGFWLGSIITVSIMIGGEERAHRRSQRQSERRTFDHFMNIHDDDAYRAVKEAERIVGR